MNYLAHAVLSFKNPEVLVGNMISDHVKGSKQYGYATGVQAGIRLHRAIDDFTDKHLVTRNMMEIFKPHYRLYAGAFVDIVYDYCLANDISIFENKDRLFSFAQQTYSLLESHLNIFPAKFQGMFPYMLTQNWLYHYGSDEGIQMSFKGLAHRATYIHESQVAFELFLEHKVFFQQQYELFFPSVKTFAAHTMAELLKP